MQNIRGQADGHLWHHSADTGSGKDKHSLEQKKEKEAD